MKDNPRQWKLPEGPFYSNMMAEANTPKGKLLLVRGVDPPLISESKGTSNISPVRGVSGEISMEKLINECNKIFEHEEEDDYHQAHIPEIGGVVQSKYLNDIKPWSSVITFTWKDFLKTEDTVVATA